MAVNQKTGYPAISLPQGAGSLPENILPYLDRFTKIILWMDNDDAGRLGA
jgi:twinkle protein